MAFKREVIKTIPTMKDNYKIKKEADLESFITTTMTVTSVNGNETKSMAKDFTTTTMMTATKAVLSMASNKEKELTISLMEIIIKDLG